jgi:predicted anti-sigma-YlaC factor YlaD
MNKQQCEQYIEWMSMAQDGMLSRTQMHVLHTHIAVCPPCMTVWESMTAVSQMFRAAPMIAPLPGFVKRFEARLAYRREQRRRAMVWLLLGIGAIALGFLALPSLIGVLSLAGYLVLPYQVLTYIQGLLSWVYVLISAVADATQILVRYVCTGPAGPACLALVAVTGALVAIWTRFLVGRLASQRAR